jgi:hypothetical protein
MQTLYTRHRNFEIHAIVTQRNTEASTWNTVYFPQFSERALIQRLRMVGGRESNFIDIQHSKDILSL